MRDSARLRLIHGPDFAIQGEECERLDFRLSPFYAARGSGSPRSGRACDLRDEDAPSSPQSVPASVGQALFHDPVWMDLGRKAVTELL